ncbi:peptidylprolyl isomerase [Phenylobacterium sp. LjRoot219]|uniref:peptidylprolyl isomerase n=1 Tax=Phenylobacterium sp. LjRoot219 TaxID=3342283 RepID=UPI003ECC89C6
MTEPSRRDLLALAAALVAQSAFTPAFAQTEGFATTPVALTTPLGRIVIALETQRAPITSANFLRYVDRKLYDGASFYRASRPPNPTSADRGLVQGGLRNLPDRLLPPIAHESTRQTGLAHLDGTISMGRHAPGTAQADWFICLGAQSYLDADDQQPGFAAFGRVTEGLEIVKQILLMPVDPNQGTGSMKGEILQTPVPITTARRV